jgi:hypothetical protein
MNDRGYIPDIWVTRDGLVLFEQHVMGVDTDMMGSLFSAIDSIASLIDSNGISSMEIGKKKLSIHKRSGVTFIVASSVKDKKKSIDQYVNTVADLFFEAYPAKFVASWDGDCAAFHGFVVPTY